jgi:hypothetical protein
MLFFSNIYPQIPTYFEHFSQSLSNRTLSRKITVKIIIFAPIIKKMIPNGSGNIVFRITQSINANAKNINKIPVV